MYFKYILPYGEIISKEATHKTRKMSISLIENHTFYVIEKNT
jgi:hypothetical protein